MTTVELPSDVPSPIIDCSSPSLTPPGIAVTWLAHDAELQLGDLLMITDYILYDIEEARVEEDLGGEKYVLRGLKTRGRYYVRKAQRKAARKNGVYDLIVKKPGSNRWVLQDRDGFWARAARRPHAPEPEPHQRSFTDTVMGILTAVVSGTQ